MSVVFAPLQLEPAYRRVAGSIGARILSRELREGERLPPETELARQFAVNRSTVREALRELESRGLVQRRAGSKLMSVARPHQQSVAAGVSDALLLHDVTVRDVWEALTILEPQLALTAARVRNAADLRQLQAAIAAYAAESADARQAAHRVAEVFRVLAHATHNPVLALAQEPLLQLLEPSLRVMIDKVPQARARIATAHQRLLETLRGRDGAGAQQWMARHIRDFRRGYDVAGIDFEMRVNSQALARPDPGAARHSSPGSLREPGT
ncbi:MAG: FadR family transcriptional regulator [Proteobacteria bacterium]|nr:FadR family transcriptional regulator [Pseudomonadota bacterium]